jgi:oligopeptide transport system substrate-binding protein
MLQAVEIPVQLRPMPFEEYKTFVASGDQQVFRLGWTGSYPSADAYLVPLFRTGSPDNVTSLSKTAADQRLLLAREATDAGRRRELYRQAERQVMADLPIIPIGQFQILSVARPEVRGLLVAVDGTFDPTAVWLADGDR